MKLHNETQKKKPSNLFGYAVKFVILAIALSQGVTYSVNCRLSGENPWIFSFAAKRTISCELAPGEQLLHVGISEFVDQDVFYSRLQIREFDGDDIPQLASTIQLGYLAYGFIGLKAYDGASIYCAPAQTAEGKIVNYSKLKPSFRAAKYAKYSSRPRRNAISISFPLLSGTQTKLMPCMISSESSDEGRFEIIIFTRPLFGELLKLWVDLSSSDTGDWIERIGGYAKALNTSSEEANIIDVFSSVIQTEMLLQLRNDLINEPTCNENMLTKGFCTLLIDILTDIATNFGVPAF